MKQKIIATTFLFILLSAACKMGDPIIGNWQLISKVDTLDRVKVLEGGEEYIQFSPDGTYSESLLFGGKWKRLDDSRLEIQTDTLGPIRGGTRIVTVKIESNVLTMTESDGKSTKFKR